VTNDFVRRGVSSLPQLAGGVVDGVDRFHHEDRHSCRWADGLVFNKLACYTGCHRLEAGLRNKELVGTVCGVAPSSAAVFRSQDCIEIPSNDQVLTGCLC
ncbi:hypothetical protein TSOC_013154, partial [Tetrabaena socialis]